MKVEPGNVATNVEPVRLEFPTRATHRTSPRAALCIKDTCRRPLKMMQEGKKKREDKGHVLQKEKVKDAKELSER